LGYPWVSHSMKIGSITTNNYCVTILCMDGLAIWRISRW